MKLLCAVLFFLFTGFESTVARREESPVSPIVPSKTVSLKTLSSISVLKHSGDAESHNSDFRETTVDFEGNTVPVSELDASAFSASGIPTERSNADSPVEVLLESSC